MTAIRSLRQRRGADILSVSTVMTIDPAVEQIRAQMEAQGKSRADLGRLLGLDSSQVNRIFKGTRRIQLHEMRAVEGWLGLAATGSAAGTTASVVPMPNMVPLYGWVGAASEGRLTMAEQNLRGYVAMHPGQMHARDAFALEVNDISMSPRYEPGEVVYLAPHRWPKRDQDCVVVTRDGQGLLKRFVRRDETSVLFRQLNPEQEFSVQVDEIDSIHAVVGRG